jgi:hypothetical protein
MIRPPIFWRNVKNAVGRSHMLFIEIEPDQPLSTLAEEVAEWQRKAAVFIPAGLVGLGLGAWTGWSIAGPFWAVLFGLAGMAMFAVIANNLVSGTRAIEYWGKAVSAAAGDNLDELAKSLSGYGQFRHAGPLETIKTEIEARLPDAIEWLEKNRAALERAYARRPQ